MLVVRGEDESTHFHESEILTSFLERGGPFQNFQPAPRSLFLGTHPGIGGNLSPSVPTVQPHPMTFTQTLPVPGAEAVGGSSKKNLSKMEKGRFGRTPLSLVAAHYLNTNRLNQSHSSQACDACAVLALILQGNVNSFTLISKRTTVSKNLSFLREHMLNRMM